METDKKTPYFKLTKLYRPAVGRDYLHRQSLLDKLNQGLYRPFTLVSAPAGYGKSTLISSWLDLIDIPAAWLSLDDKDNDFREFLSGFVASLQSIFPDICGEFLSMVSTPGPLPDQLMVNYLTNNMCVVEREFILVLDDFHLVTDQSVKQFIQELLRHPPRKMHLVLIGRKDPFLPISSLRARDQISEVRITDLRFNKNQTKEFLEIVLDSQVEDHVANQLADRTEGWITGIKLAVMAARRQAESTIESAALESMPAYTREYLLTEVLKAQEPAVRDFLLVTSIMDRFNKKMCNALYSPISHKREKIIDANDIIEILRKEDLFLIALDDDYYWFRYHHLFKDFLSTQLTQKYSSKEIALFHMRASEWFSANGSIEEAIQHSLYAGNIEGAIDLIEEYRLAILSSNKGYMFEKWLAILPDDMVEKRPHLLLMKVWAHYFQNNFVSIPPIIAALESIVKEDKTFKQLSGEIYLFKGVFSYMKGDGPNAFTFMQQAMKLIPEKDHMIRGFTEIYFGLAGQMQGEEERVLPVLSDVVYQKSLNFERKYRVMISLIWIHIISGDLSNAATLNTQMGVASREKNEVTFNSWSLYNQGLIHLHRNELQKAITHLKQATENGLLMLRRATVDCLAALALAYCAAKNQDEAAATLDNLFQYVHSLNDPTLLEIADSCRTRLSLINERESLQPVIPMIKPTSTVGVMAIWCEIPRITLCRALIAEGSEQNLSKAEELLERYAELNKSHHNSSQLITIYCLRAVVYGKQKEYDEAFTWLRQALALARPGGFLFPFLEIGKPMQELLGRLYQTRDVDSYIETVLTAFGIDTTQLLATTSSTTAETSSYAVSQSLVDPLTNREIEVLELLGDRLQTKEISEQLFISPETVKVHLRNIYQKLDVSSRRQAVLRAMELGILAKR